MYSLYSTKKPAPIIVLSHDILHACGSSAQVQNIISFSLESANLHSLQETKISFVKIVSPIQTYLVSQHFWKKWKKIHLDRKVPPKNIINSPYTWRQQMFMKVQHINVKIVIDHLQKIIFLKNT